LFDAFWRDRCSLKQSDTGIEDIAEIFQAVSSLQTSLSGGNPRILELSIPTVYDPLVLQSLQAQFAALGIMLDFEYSQSVSWWFGEPLHSFDVCCDVPLYKKPFLLIFENEKSVDGVSEGG
jgi:hypothetical protein